MRLKTLLYTLCLRRYRAVSFDIFDTLLERDVDRPVDVFLRVGDIVLGAGKGERFQADRIGAENAARAKAPNGEVTLDDIYEALVASGYDRPTAEELKTEEVRSELNGCFVKASMKPVFDAALKRGKTVFLISDMYLAERKALRRSPEGVRSFEERPHPHRRQHRRRSARCPESGHRRTAGGPEKQTGKAREPLMKKILEVNVDDMGFGGVYSLVRNVILAKPAGTTLDIACIEPFEQQKNIDELADRGCMVHYVGYAGNKVKKQFVIIQNLKILIREGGYEAVHIHGDVAYKLLVYSVAARLSGVNCPA